MKTFGILFLLSLVGTCASPRYSERVENIKNNITVIDSAEVERYSETITADELKRLLYSFASEEFQGRKTGEPGQRQASEFLKSYYIDQGIKSPFGGDNYFQGISKSYFPDDIGASENVLAYIEGSEKPNEILVLSAHLDHEGIEDGEVFYGADDNGSGTVVLLEIAEAFKIASKNGHPPKRSILFTHFTAEELGKLGSEFYVQNPVFPLENTIANLNIDMIGRSDERHADNKDYIYIIGSDRHSKELHFTSEAIRDTYVDIDLDYKYNALNDRNHYYSRSDHYNFAREGVPVIFYFSGEHEDYGKSTDTPDKIDYELLTKRAKLIFATAWQIANQEQRVVLDENNVFLN
ncbi:M28 family peptidase [Hyunsoonleella sp. SJ7]|uniref:M28 family peptidase n=1 Tax=Hyunsoonleella aquatilis TaxID=2762758 RepID=A0A923HEC1_9FLAO|nr:M28 family peptidase [Hyunsoonleella aquatilis]MBC3759596.1 M28 family peptidase [Hyunsoonleella aquatilis]